MTDTPPSTLPLLPPGKALGPNRVVRGLGVSDLGASYEVTFGTTAHVYRLLVLAAQEAADDGFLESVVRRLAAVSHPCLAKPFAWGRDEGLAWIRSELPRNATFGDFLPPAKREDDLRPRDAAVADALQLRELCGGSVPQELLCPVVRDLLEGLVCLHRAGILVGRFALDAVLFQKVRHGKGSLAKWADYGLWPLQGAGAAGEFTFQNDLRGVGRLIRALLGGDQDVPPAAAWVEWEDFLVSAEGGEGGFADAAGMLQAFVALVKARGVTLAPREPREGDDATLPTTETQGRVEGGGTRSRAHERRKRVGVQRGTRHSSATETSASAPVGPAFRLGVVLVALCLVAYASYWVLSRPDRMRKEGLIGPSKRNTTTTPAEPVAAAERDLWSLSASELEELAKNGDAKAAMRWALRTAQGDDQAKGDAVRGDELARPAVEKLRAQLDGGRADGDVLYWLGHALLTGFGVERDEEQGVVQLERAIKEFNHFRAMALLADYLAFAREEAVPEDDRRALDLWMKAVDVQRTITPHAAECIDRVVALVLADRGLPRNDATAAVQWLERVARSRHTGAMLGLGLLTLEGKVVPLDEPRAMNWFRSAALSGSAEGMRRMGWMLERGVGTPQSDKSAAIWYRRAALGGDGEAMERLAALMEAQRGDEVADPAAQTEWRRKAVEAKERERLQAARLRAWWTPGSAPSGAIERGAPPQVPAATVPSPATPSGATPAAPGPAPTESPVPPVHPELMSPGEGRLVPME